MNKLNPNIKIVGTSHISKESHTLIAKAVEEFKPDIIAVELDRNRFLALQEQDLHKTKPKGPSIGDIRKLGLTGFLFMLLGRWAQKKLGDVVGVEPGTDMKEAIKICKREKLILGLIDRDITITMQRLSKKFSFREKMRVLWDVISAPFSKKRVTFDLTKIPKDELIIKLISELKDRYPSLYEVLIDERNKFMAKKIFRLSKEKKVLCVIGAGHKEGLIKDLEALYYSNPSSS